MAVFRWIGLLSCLLLSACTSHHKLHLLGYIEGRFVYLSSPVSGQLIQLAVQKGETVSTNQLAFRLDPEPESSQLKSAQADLLYTGKMLERNQELRKTGAIGEAALDFSRQQHEIALRKVTQFQWMVTEKTQHFAQDGFVQDTLFRQNEFVPAGKPVIQFLPPANRILIFFVPETQLSQIKMGQVVTFTRDGSKKSISASINYIASQAQYTPPVIYSKDSREKLVYWVEAKIDPAVVKTMNPGQPVEVSIP